MTKTTALNRTPHYTDGTPVQEGDRIRYHQAPGGILAPPMHFRNGEWTPWREGTAARSRFTIFGEHELVLEDESGSQYGITGHVIERLEQNTITTGVTP